MNEVDGKIAADSLSSSVDWGETDTSYEELEKIPVSQILQQAEKISGRSDDFFVEKDLFLVLPQKSQYALLLR